MPLVEKGEPAPAEFPELSHWYCDCSHPVMLCGSVDTSHECPDDGSCGCQLCLVCEDLIDLPCQRCGAE